MSTIATCPDCNKRYNLPHTDKAWECKVCKVELELEVEPRSRAGDAGADCPDCGAPADPGTHFCGECGADFGGGEELGRERKRLERKERGKVLRRAANPIGKLRNILQAWTVLTVLLFVVALFGAFVAWGEPESSLVTAIAICLAIEVVLLVVVLKQLNRRPFPAVLSLAIFRTVFFVLFNATGLVASLKTGSFDLLLMVPLGVTIFYWIVTVRVAALAKLLKENPDMYAARRMRGETKHLQQRDGEARTRHAARSKGGVPWIAVGVGATLVVLGYGGLKLSEHLNKPEPPPEPTAPTEAIAAFREAWNAGDIEALIVDIREHRQGVWRGRFEKRVKRYSWETHWPTISSFAIAQQTSKRVQVEYETEIGTLDVRFGWTEKEDWDLSSIVYERLNLPEPN